MLLNSRENNLPLRFAMIGNGSWATALTKVLLNSQEKLQWFVRESRMISYIEKYHRNPDFLRSAQLDVTRLEMSDDINIVVRNADVLVFCIPAAFLKLELDKFTESLQGKFIVTAIKGMIPDDN
ncbi:MAG: glycerol-3-phosphate dehydrogenase, partial [Prevotellaceae bacterium]|nr:glycerol-3-phosphate dehydrogenase [Prevotellaceae bacterium]